MSSAPDPKPRRPPRSILLGAVAVAMGVLAGLAIVLAAPMNPAPSEVQVTGFTWVYHQGTIPSGPLQGIPWFGQNGSNMTGAANGYPVEVPSGGTLVIWLLLRNEDSVNHTVTEISLDSPARFHSASPPLPAIISSGEGEQYAITVEVDAPAGSTVLAQGQIWFG